MHYKYKPKYKYKCNQEFFMPHSQPSSSLDQVFTQIRQGAKAGLTPAAAYETKKFLYNAQSAFQELKKEFNESEDGTFYTKTASDPTRKNNQLRLLELLSKLRNAIHTRNDAEAFSLLKEEGEEIFYIAAINGRYDDVALILDFYNKNQLEIGFLRINYNCDNRPSGIHTVLQNKHFEVADLLLDEYIKKNMNIHAPNKLGVRPLHLAAIHGQEALVRKIANHLISEGREDEIVKRGSFKRGKLTAFDCAIHNGHLAIVQFLLAYTPKKNLAFAAKDALVHNQTEIAIAILTVSEQKGLNINPSFDNEGNLLHLSILKGNTTLSLYLIEKQNEKDQEINPYDPATGYTPLHLAAELGLTAVVKEIVKIKKQKNISINPIISEKRPFTPYSLAAKGKHFDIIATYLSYWPFDEDLNLLIGKRKTVLQAAIEAEHPVVHDLLPKLIGKWEEDIFYPRGHTNDWYWKDICRGLVYTNQKEILIQHLKVIFSQPDNIHKTDDPQETQKDYEKMTAFLSLEYAAQYHNKDIAQALLLFLKENMHSESIISLLTCVNEIFPPLAQFNCLIPIAHAIQEEINTLNRFKINHIKRLQSLVQTEPKSKCMPENQAHFNAMHEAYRHFSSAIKNKIIDLKALSNMASINAQFAIMLKDINQAKKAYQQARDAFLLKEVQLQEAGKSALNENLFEKMDYIAWVKSDIITQIEDYLKPKRASGKQRLRLEKYQFDLNKTVSDCENEIHKSQANFFISPTLAANFDELRNIVRNAQIQDLITFEAQEKNKSNKAKIEADLIKEKMQCKLLRQSLENLNAKTLSTLEHLKRILKRLPHRVLYHSLHSEWIALTAHLHTLSEEITETFSSDFFADLLEQKLNDHEHQFEVIQQAAQKLDHQIQQAQEQETQELSGEQHACEQQLKEKIEEIKQIIIPLIKRPFYEDAPKETDYTGIVNSLDKIKFFDGEYKNNPRHKIIAYYRAEFEKWSAWLTQEKERIAALIQRIEHIQSIRIHSAKMVPLNRETDSLDAAAVYLPSGVKPKIARNKQRRVFNCPLEKYCPKEMRTLESMILLLKQHDLYSATTKASALLLAVAKLFEAIGKIAKDNPDELRPHSSWISVAVQIRNVIFHKFQGKDITEENFQWLLAWADNLHNSWDKKNLDLLLEATPIIPNTPDASSLLAQIDDHIQCLTQYIIKINNGLDLNKNVLAQADIAFRVAQLDRLMKDLKNMANQSVPLAIAYGARIARINNQLNMKYFKLRSAANAIRHEGEDSIVDTAENLYICLALTFSMADPAVNALASEMGELHLQSEVQASSVLEKIKI